MNYQALIFSAVLGAISPWSHASDTCANGALYDQNQCMGNELGRLDKELNKVYREALKSMPESDETDIRRSKEQLRKSQRAWLVFTRENCALEGGFEGGSNPNVTLMEADCEEKEYKSRIDFLKKIAADESGK